MVMTPKIKLLVASSKLYEVSNQNRPWEIVIEFIELIICKLHFKHKNLSLNQLSFELQVEK